MDKDGGSINWVPFWLAASTSNKFCTMPPGSWNLAVVGKCSKVGGRSLWLCSPSIEFGGLTRRLSFDSGPLSSLIVDFDGLAGRLFVDSGPLPSPRVEVGENCGGSTKQVSFDSGSLSSTGNVGERH